MLSRSCQWKRPSMGAQKNEFGERHEVLTTIGCEVKSEKPRARNLFRFLQSRPISNELYINFPPHEDGKTFNMNENYSIKFRKGIHGLPKTVSWPISPFLAWSCPGYSPSGPGHCPLNPGPSNPFLRGRHHKQTNSTIKYSTGLIRLEEGTWFLFREPFPADFRSTSGLAPDQLPV